ncbi:MAG: hypothetical protein JW749_00245 [Sedimentisphaerales bacterium]|nr:hypothetical protein [Sedimentisphaerales bacterium]
MLKDVLEVVPYCNEHKSVWSPKLVTMLQETCSQIDSLWSYEINHGEARLNIENYCSHFGDKMRPKWLVFWGEHPEKIQPFGGWNAINAAQSLPWWQAYQNVKHNRIINREQATLENAVKALAGLFLAILRCESCRDGVGHGLNVSHDTTTGYCNPLDCLSDVYDCANPDRDSVPSVFTWQYIAVESKLFSYPVGWWAKQKNVDENWGGHASYRFRTWFASQSW